MSAESASTIMGLLVSAVLVYAFFKTDRFKTNEKGEDMDKKKIEPGDWVYVGPFRGKVIRIRERKGNVWVDVEIRGVIDPYRIGDVVPE